MCDEEETESHELASDPSEEMDDHHSKHLSADSLDEPVPCESPPPSAPLLPTVNRADDRPCGSCTAPSLPSGDASLVFPRHSSK